MAHEQYTRCPGCSTIFRVTPQQLALREGQVRCGHCRTVFDGNAQLISLAPSLPGEQEHDELASGPPTVTLRSAHALRPAHEDADAAAPREPIGAARVMPASVEDEDDEEGVDYDSRFAWDRPRKRPRALTALYVAAIPLLFIALA